MIKKEYVTREEFEKEGIKAGGIILFILLIVVFNVYIMIQIMDEKLKDVPHKVCYNETETKKVEYNISMSNYEDAYLGCITMGGYWENKTYHFLCSGTINSREYPEASCTYTRDYSEIDKLQIICRIDEIKEICEIE